MKSLLMIIAGLVLVTSSAWGITCPSSQDWTMFSCSVYPGTSITSTTGGTYCIVGDMTVLSNSAISNTWFDLRGNPVVTFGTNVYMRDNRWTGTGNLVLADQAVIDTSCIYPPLKVALGTASINNSEVSRLEVNGGSAAVQGGSLTTSVATATGFLSVQSSAVTYVQVVGWSGRAEYIGATGIKYVQALGSDVCSVWFKNCVFDDATIELASPQNFPNSYIYFDDCEFRGTTRFLLTSGGGEVGHRNCQFENPVIPGGGITINLNPPDCSQWPLVTQTPTPLPTSTSLPTFTPTPTRTPTFTTPPTPTMTPTPGLAHNVFLAGYWDTRLNSSEDGTAVLVALADQRILNYGVPGSTIALYTNEPAGQDMWYFRFPVFRKQWGQPSTNLFELYGFEGNSLWPYLEVKP